MFGFDGAINVHSFAIDLVVSCGRMNYSPVGFGFQGDYLSTAFMRGCFFYYS